MALAFVFHHITVYPDFAVNVGAVILQLVSQLYLVQLVVHHACVAALLSCIVNVALNAVGFFVCAYHVHHAVVLIACVAFDHTAAVLFVALLLNHITLVVTVLLIVGVVTLHVDAQLYHVQLFVTSAVHPSNLFPFGLYVAVVHL